MLLWLHRSKVNKDGRMPLILRLSYQRQRAQKAIGYYVNPKEWNADKQKVRGIHPEATEINNRIVELTTKLSLLSRGNGMEEVYIHLPTLISRMVASSPRR